MKIGIVGAGLVGSTTAFALVMRGVGSEIVLVDAHPERAGAEVQDLAHATPFSHALRLSAGDFADLADAAVIIVAAGVNQKPGESRLQLLERNAQVFREVIPPSLRASPQALLIIATNPVDVLTQVAVQISGLPAERVIGSGTILDTARFRTLIGHHLGIAPHSVHANVVGEHGDSEVLVWSSARAGTLPVAAFGAQVGAALTAEVRDTIDAGVRGAARTIIAGKGATYYGIAAGLARLVDSIAGDERAVLTVSAVAPEVEGVREVAVSIPRVIGRQGIEVALYPELDAAEENALERSARIIRDAVDSL